MLEDQAVLLLTTSKALVTTSVALVPSSVALVTTSFGSGGVGCLPPCGGCAPGPPRGGLTFFSDH